MEKKRLGTGKIAFLARVDAIREKINAGHTVAMLHDEYKKEIGINYGQFLNYVNRYIRRKPDGNSNATEKGKDIKATTPVRVRTPDQPAFVSSPTPRDNLIHPKPKE
jgi:hypothetical protein